MSSCSRTQRPSKASIRLSGGGASKSGGTTATPVRAPRRRFARPSAGDNGTKRVIGFPALAINISSPAAAWSTNHDKFALAASASKARMFSPNCSATVVSHVSSTRA